MKREIIAYKGYFKEFFENLDAGTQDKILYVLMLLQTQDRIPLKFMRLIEEGLYELRIEYQSNIYRIFFCFDEGRIVILFNGFQKKTEKTPKEAKTNEEFFNVSALIDERFGKEGTASRAEAEEKAYAFYTGQIIEDARKKAKITQAELARRIGSDRSYISRVESGQTEPKVSTFYRIMNALGCKIEFSMIL